MTALLKLDYFPNAKHNDSQSVDIGRIHKIIY